MKFLVFEGLDGAGKSTLMRGLQAELQTRGISFCQTREPGGTPLAEDIRQCLLRTDGEAPIDRCEVLLYEASRAQHVEKVIRPALLRGDWVLCDRFYASTVAFQAGGRRISRAEINWLNAFAIAGCEPDLTVLLDISIEESEKRLVARAAQGDEKDRLEREQRDFHERVRQSFLQQAEEQHEKWLVLDATKPSQILLSQLIQRLEENHWLSC